jgi:hypothetical protein
MEAKQAGLMTIDIGQQETNDADDKPQMEKEIRSHDPPFGPRKYLQNEVQKDKTYANQWQNARLAHKEIVDTLHAFIDPLVHCTDYLHFFFHDIRFKVREKPSGQLAR